LPALRGTDVAPASQAAAPSVSPGQTNVLVSAVPPGTPKALVVRNAQLDAYFRAHRELAATGVMPSAVAYIRMSGEPDR
jgi:hypothetical protein